MAASANTKPPFRAEHIGSLLRPRDLIEAHHQYQSGSLSAARLQQVQDKCIGEVVALQETIGFQAVTDGEFRRPSYFGHFIDKLEGLTAKESLFSFQDDKGEKFKFYVPHAEGKLRRPQGISTGDLEFLKKATRRVPKITMPSPSTLHFFRGRQGVDPSAYPDEEQYFEDVVRVYREELAGLVAAGATYVQIDEVPLAMLCDDRVRESVKARGEDPERLTRKYIEMVNEALKGRPPGLTAAMHLCRGNYKAKWLSEGGYDQVAERLFNETDVDAFFLEYDSPRAGGFEPLRLLPKNKMAVLGLISSKNPALESSADLKKRVEEASRFVPLERLAISPQCGFGTSVGSRPATQEEMVRKLQLVVDTAGEIWG